MIRLDSQSAVEHAKSISNSSLLSPDQLQRLKVVENLLFALTSPIGDHTNGFHVDCGFSGPVESPSAWGTTRVVTMTRSFGPGVSVGGVGGVSVGFGDYGASTGISDSYRSVETGSVGVSAGGFEPNISVEGTATGFLKDIMGISGYSGVRKTIEVKVQTARTRVSCCQLEADFCENPLNMSTDLLGAD